MQIKSTFMDSSKSSQSDFAEPPKVLNAVDMISYFTAKLPLCKFIFSMPNSVVLFISKISKSIIRFPRIRENYRIIPNLNLLFYYGQKLTCRTVFNYLSKKPLPFLLSIPKTGILPLTPLPLLTLILLSPK